jgi:5-methylcytosine-specific restriction protein A
MKIPRLERTSRRREYDSYSTIIRAKVVHSYLFDGLSHRALDKEIIGLDPDKSKGWQSMGILHFLGLKNTHKNLFSGMDTELAVKYLLKIETEDTALVASYIKKYEDKGILDKDSFEREFQKQVSESIQTNTLTRLERLKAAENDTTKQVEVISIAFKRNADVVAAVLERAAGICECCMKKAPFLRAKDNTPYLEVHHKVRLADGGKDNLDNAIALCPNCHRKEHFGKTENA